MKKSHLILLCVNVALLGGFGCLFMARQNFEFVIYVGVILFFMVLVGLSLKHVPYTLATLVALTVWSGLHMAGGGITVGEGRLYDVMLLPISESYPIFRYDQLVHIWGFAASTLVVYCLMFPLLKRPAENPIAVGIVLVMAGLGMGALNEILEFVVAACVPESGVGGYMNTSLDLCADLIGALLGLLYIRLRVLRGQGRPADA